MVGQLREKISASNIFKSLQQVGMTINFLDEPILERQTRLQTALQLINKGDVSSGIEYLQSLNSIIQVKKGQSIKTPLRDYISLT
jgi:hypothetical protein